MSLAPTSLFSVPCKTVIGYYASWTYWAGYTPAVIPYSKFTHLCHAFADPTNTGGLTIPADITTQKAALVAGAHAVGTKVLLSIGGASAAADTAFASISANSTYRATFATNIKNFLIANNYDGVDVDWEFPSNTTERANFTLMIKAIRDAFNAAPAHPEFLITAAVSASNWYGQWIDFSTSTGVGSTMDMFNVMTYDFHGTWSAHAGHNANLGNATGDPVADAFGGVASMNYYLITRGVPASKINFGLAFYARRFPAPGLHMACTGSGPDGACDPRPTNIEYLKYTEVTPLLGTWTYTWDTSASSPYIRDGAGTSLISYDNPRSITTKAKYAWDTRSVNGVFVWEISQDYSAGNQPLLDAIMSCLVCQTPTPTATRTITRTVTQTSTPSPSPTRTHTPTASPTGSPTRTPSRTVSPTGTFSFSPTGSPTRTPTVSPSSSATPINSPTVSPTRTGSRTPTPYLSPTDTATRSATPSVSPSLTNTPYFSPTSTRTPSVTPSGTPSITPSRTPTPYLSPTDTATRSATPSVSPSVTDTPYLSPTSTRTPSVTPSGTPSVSPSRTPTLYYSPTSTRTPSRTPSVSPSRTPSATSSATAYQSPTSTVTPSSSATASPVASPTISPVATATFTASPTSTAALAPASSGNGGKVAQVVAVPNPQQATSGFLSLAGQVVDGDASSLKLKLYTTAMVCVMSVELPGPFNPGWKTLGLPLPAGLAGGLYYVELSAPGSPARQAKVYLLP